ncbi:hypothetical protein OG884_18810 [Streptosporangium sp. NBC_01755]|uniref:hypothetical protein n=1 Tax=Streptosporangium sp. NBC_01755 TaxID=2975949 RepID=UPI002DD92F56|nr:hypothetical protein [Streptosporangium sp. NBC_01755]WSD03860.1 hypothetical protein OG884_18810 [Streptosporangium sp. NBC_01755]
MAIDYSTDVGQVRLLIADTDPASQLLNDPQIEAFLAMEGSVKRAAAQALDVIASSEALVSKVISMNGLSIDGTKVAGELRSRASELRRQLDDGDGDDSVGFAIVDFDRHTGYLGYVP